jgi:hypothetical protein
MKEYEGIIKLINAIYNSDSDYKENKSVIAVYDMDDNEQLIATFSKSKYCADFFKTSKKTIDCCVCRELLRKGRFKIIRVNLEE